MHCHCCGKRLKKGYRAADIQSHVSGRNYPGEHTYGLACLADMTGLTPATAKRVFAEVKLPSNR